jgi:DNA-binding response OmpR family regulator
MAVVALIDADPLQARLITDNLRSVGHIVVWAERGWDGLVLVYNIRPDMVIVDCDVPQWRDLLHILRSMRTFSTVPRILIAGRAPSAYSLHQLGVTHCIERYFNAEDFVDQIQMMLAQQGVPSSAMLREAPAKETPESSPR